MTHSRRSAVFPLGGGCALVVLVSLLQGCAGDMSAIDAGHARWLAEGAALSDRLDPLPARADALRADPESDGIDAATLHGAEDYVQLALSRSPMLRAAETRVRRLEQRVPQVMSLDDPMLMVAPVGEMAETAAGRVGMMTSLSQKLPLDSKLKARGRVAEQDVQQARAELQRARVGLAADVRRAYWTHALATRTIETTRQSREILAQFRDVADAQYRSGARAQQDVFKASVELGSIDTRLARLAERRDTAAAMLRRLLSAPPGFTIPESTATPSEDVIVDRERLLARAGQANPALHILAEQLEQFEARQRLARLARWPDLTISVSYNFVDQSGLAPSTRGDDQWWVGLGVNLPIWQDKLDAAEREAMFGRLEAASALSAEHDRVAFDVESALLVLGSRQEVLEVLRAHVLPDARAAVEASANAYGTGTGDFLELLDNWRKLLAQEILEHQVSAGIEQARADLAQAVGDESLTTGEPTHSDPAGPTTPAESDPEGETP